MSKIQGTSTESKTPTKSTHASAILPAVTNLKDHTKEKFRFHER
jgi:hypothetical protein